jgi:hypothetical protein
MKPEVPLAYKYLSARLLQRRLSYELGTSEDTTFAGVSFLGTTILLPGDADEYLRTTDTQVKAVANDVAVHRTQLPADFLASWDFFKNDWDAFFGKHLGDVNIVDGGRALMGETDTYVARLAGYQQKMGELKVTPNVPGVVIDPSSTMVANKPLSTTEKLAIGAAAVVGAAMLYKAVK